jgi:hypothetical protein
MSSPFISDLRASQDLQCAVTIRTWNGEEIFTGVKDLNEENKYVVFYNPQTSGGEHTTKMMRFYKIVSVTLHSDIAYTAGGDQPEDDTDES